jgi:Bacterial protein of unknown function (HtrL_YibB)
LIKAVYWNLLVIIVIILRKGVMRIIYILRKQLLAFLLCAFVMYGFLPAPRWNSQGRNKKGPAYTTTVVSAYYPMRSKRAHSVYAEYMKNFLSIHTIPLIVFTDNETATFVEGMRDPKRDKLISVVRREFATWKLSNEDAMEHLWRVAHGLDAEKNVHSPELYAMWANKAAFVLEGIRMNPHSSQYFVWCDIGIMRNREQIIHYAQFPHYTPAVAAPDRMHLLEVAMIAEPFYRHWKNHSQAVPKPWPYIALGGGVLFGDKNAWIDFEAAYDATIREIKRRGLFYGKDQDVFFVMLIERRVKNPFRLMLTPASNESKGIDPWMVMPAYLSGSVPARFDTRFE